SMKKNSSGKRSAPQNVPPEKVGWIRKFCGKGIFREIWKNRFVVLRGDQLFICEKEVSQRGRGLQVTSICHAIDQSLGLIRSTRSLMPSVLTSDPQPGDTPPVPNLVFLAVSPEEKESWINVLNATITRAKNSILDEVTVEDSQLSHLTRDRVKIPHNRRLPTRGHLLAVASTSSSDGMLTLDLIQEEDAAPAQGANLEKSVSHLSPDCPRSKTDGALSARMAEASGKSHSLPREVTVVSEQTPQPEKRLTTAEKNRCASMDEILTHSETKAAKNKMAATSRSSASVQNSMTAPLNQLQELISQKLEKTERLLKEVRGEAEGERGKVKSGKELTESERLLKEAKATWIQAQEVLEEVKELRALYRQLDPTSPDASSKSSKLNRKSLM
uniref:Pleckstrin homology domain containing, family O member 1b n=1 Tax=Amphilophus citrinellus TaxID=61819 RepID=A0A3Q0R4T7_AMPCI